MSKQLSEMTQGEVDDLFASVEKLENAVDRYKTENKKFRLERDEYKDQAEAGEANEKFKNSALRSEAKLGLSALGIKDPDRVVKYLDFSGVSFDDEGKITGLDKSIDAVKGDFPELFDAKRRVGGKIDAAASGPTNVAKSTSQLQAEQMLR